MDKNKTKIINIVSNYSSVYGGNFIPSIIAITNELSKKSKVILSFPVNSKQRKWMSYLIQNGFDVEFFDSRDSKFIKRDVKNINKRRKVTIVYTHFLSALLAKSLALFDRRIKLIIHLHSDFTGGKRMPISFKFKKFLADQIFRRDALYIYDSIQQKNNSKAKRCWQIPSGISFDRIPCESIDINLFKKTHNITEKDYVFLIFGWSPFVKGVDVVCNALAACLDKKRKDIKLMIVHGKDDGYEKCLNYIKTKNNFACVKDNVILVPPTEDVFSYYRIADVFISSSRSEGFPYSILEALAMNKPILVSDIDATKWSFEFDTVFGYSVEDYSKLADLMLSVKTKCQNLDFEKNREIALSKYSISVWVDRVMSVFSTLVK